MNVDFGKWAFRNKQLIWLFVIVLLAGGVYSYFAMPKLEDPEITVRQAVVAVIEPGASAHQIELDAVDPLEKRIRETPGVNFVETFCYADLALIRVVLGLDVPDGEVQQKWDIIRRKVSATTLPAGVTTQVRDDFGDVYGMFYAVSGEGFTPGELAGYVELIQREILNIEGVSSVKLFGVPKECIRIQMRQDRLANLGVLPVEVIRTLDGQNSTVYSGYFKNGNNRMRVSVDDRYRSVDDIMNLIIQGHEFDQIRLKDIATVVQEEETPVREELLYDGVRSIGLSISALSGSDITEVGRRVGKKLKELQQSRIPVGIEIEKVFNQPDRVQDAMSSFLLSLLMSVILVIMVLVFTMGMRSSLIIGTTLVAVVMGSVMFLYYTGGSLQRVSLSSFIFAMGMLVDNAIVIVDGILVAKAEGKSGMEALTGIGKKTAWPLLGATLIAILSFLPIYLSPDVTGLYVHDLFIILTVSLLLSWILALTLVPMMADKWLLPHIRPSEGHEFSSKPYLWLKKTLKYLLAHKAATVSALLVLLALSGVGALFMPKALFPDMEYNQLYMEYKLPENRNHTQVQQDLDSICVWLRKQPEIEHVVTSIGGTPSRYNLVRNVNFPSLSYGELIIDYTSAKALKRSYHRMQEEVQAMFPDAYVRFRRYNLMFMRYPIMLAVSGPDPAVLEQYKDSCLRIMYESGVCESIREEWEQSQPALVVGYDQATARRAGLSRQEVGMSLLASTDGIPVGTYRDGLNTMNIYVDCVDAEGKPLSNLDDATVFGLAPSLLGLADLNIKDINRESILQAITKSAPLGQVTEGTRIEWEDPITYRYNGYRTKSIGASPVPGYPAEKARRIIAKQIDRIEVPDGYSITWFGEKMAEKMAMTNLFHYYPIALLLIFAILLMLFHNLKTVAVLVCSIPALFVGVVPAILISGTTFGFVAIVGVLGLVGMIIKNGIILVDEIRLQARENDNMEDALITASESRLRPVTMAAFTTVLGMIPLLFDAMFSSMAATIMGGLLVGTVIVLFLIPVLYSLFFNNKKKGENN